MKDFLNQIKLSENAITLYLKAFNNTPLTYFELYSLLPKLEKKDFDSTLNELVDRELILKVESEISELLNFYHILPPIKPILNYFKNISSSFTQIESQIMGLIKDNIEEIYEKHNKIELDKLYKSYQEVKKDFEEDSLLQKQDVDDTIKSMENIKDISKTFEKLYKNIKGIAKTQFGNLVKNFSNLRKRLVEKIQSLEIKKDEEIVIETIEELFKNEQEQLVEDFISSLNQLIDEEFKKIKIRPYIEKNLQHRDELKMVLLNILTNFEIKMNHLNEIIKKNKDNLDSNINFLKEKLKEELTYIIEQSLEEISMLNSPVIKLLENYLRITKDKDYLSVENLWYVKNLTRVNEEIASFLPKAKDEIILIVPKIENHLTIEELQKVPEDVRIKLVSSDPHVNSLVKTFKELPNLEFRNYDNKKILGLKVDSQYSIIGIIKEQKKDPINDFIGFGTNYISIVNLTSSIFRSLWKSAIPDKSHPLRGGPSSRRFSPKKQEIKKRSIETRKGSKEIKTSVHEPIKSESHPSTIPEETPEEPKRKTPPTQEISETQVSKVEEESKKDIYKSKEPELEKADGETSTEQMKSDSFVSQVNPKPKDQAGIEINIAFNNILKKLSQFKAQEFSKELENIADLILEKKGFSVTLHSVRSIINEYKNRDGFLSEDDKTKIFSNIENWKNRLF